MATHLIAEVMHAGPVAMLLAVLDAVKSGPQPKPAAGQGGMGMAAIDPVACMDPSRMFRPGG